MKRGHFINIAPLSSNINTRTIHVVLHFATKYVLLSDSDLLFGASMNIMLKDRFAVNSSVPRV